MGWGMQQKRTRKPDSRCLWREVEGLLQDPRVVSKQAVGWRDCGLEQCGLEQDPQAAAQARRCAGVQREA